MLQVKLGPNCCQTNLEYLKKYYEMLHILLNAPLRLVLKTATQYLRTRIKKNIKLKNNLITK